jgi:hypothetical protein
MDKTMDFFSKVDNARYAKLKSTYLNNLQLRAFDLPKDLNAIFP